MPALHPQDFSAMAVLQPQKVIHDSSHLWRSYESYHWARQLAAIRSQKRSGVIILVYSEAGEPEVGFWEVRSLVQIVGDSYKGMTR